jgi:ABC-type transporter Mla subunit MlaD
MSNPALNQPETAVPSDGESRDPIADALKTIEQTHAALMRVRAQVEDATRLLSEFARISAVFDSVGDRLVNATFKASGEATRGVPSHTVLVAFVEELGDLARLSLGGARDVRRELRARSNQTTPSAATLQDADAALKQLANSLRRISQRPSHRPAASAARPVGAGARAGRRRVRVDRPEGRRLQELSRKS